MSSQEEAEVRYGHPIQYALVGREYIGNTEYLDDDTIRGLADAFPAGLPVERFNRCPTCEQWSPCDRRR